MAIYDEIGGEAAVDKLVEIFYDSLLKNQKVNHFFAKTDMKKQRAMQKSFINHVLGGKPYNGRSMTKAHAHLNLTDEHFDIVADTLKRSLEELGVGVEHVKQIMAVVETTREDVLGRSAEARALKGKCCHGGWSCPVHGDTCCHCGHVIFGAAVVALVACTIYWVIKKK